MTQADMTNVTPNPVEPPLDVTPDAEVPAMTDPGVLMTDAADRLTESERELTTDDDALVDTPRMLTREDAARAILTGLACELGEGEVRVLARIAERLKGGQATYGMLHLENDLRQFRAKEAREEVEDALVYLACAWLQHQEVT